MQKLLRNVLMDFEITNLLVNKFDGEISWKVATCKTGKDGKVIWRWILGTRLWLLLERSVIITDRLQHWQYSLSVSYSKWSEVFSTCCCYTDIFHLSFLCYWQQ
jgi:hypothetical protein